MEIFFTFRLISRVSNMLSLSLQLCLSFFISFFIIFLLLNFSNLIRVIFCYLTFKLNKSYFCYFTQWINSLELVALELVAPFIVYASDLGDRVRTYWFSILKLIKFVQYYDLIFFIFYWLFVEFLIWSLSCWIFRGSLLDRSVMTNLLGELSNCVWVLLY